MDGFDALPDPKLTSETDWVENGEYKAPDKCVIPQVPQAVIDHLDAEAKKMLDERNVVLEPLVLLDVPKPGKMIYFSTPGPTDSMLKFFTDFYAIGNGDRTLFGEFPHPEPKYPDYPTFTWKETYSLSDARRMRAGTFGYHGETKPPAVRWFNSFSLKYYGFQSPAMWDHYEWLGLGENENEFRRDFDRRNYLRVKVPACRYAGLNAYELQGLEYLKMKKPVDCAWWVMRFATGMDYTGRHEWFLSLIQSGLDEAFTVVKKPPVRVSARPRLKR
jgi:hypothetical protein